MAATLAAPARAANEGSLWLLWQQHIASPDNHDAILNACRGFASSNPNDPLVPVVHGIEAWHLFRALRKDDAVRLLEPYLAPPPGPVTGGAQILARAWFTRLDRERVVQALQAYYRKEVRYPRALEEIAANPRIPESQHPPLLDQFRQPWQYRLTGFRKLPGFEDQRYDLRSALLGNTSDFAAALKMPYGSAIVSQPAEVLGDARKSVLFKEADSGKSVSLTVGQQAGNLYLAFAGDQVLVVCDLTHWKVFQNPR